MQHLWVRCVPKVLGVRRQEDVPQKEYPKSSPQHGVTSWEMSMGVPGLPGSENCIFRPQSACPDKLGTQTISWVRATVLGSGERWLWGPQRQRKALPHPITHCPSKGVALAVQNCPKEKVLPLL